MKILKNVLPVLLLFSFASSFGCHGGCCGSVSEKEKAAIKKKYKEIRSIKVKDKYKYDVCKLSQNCDQDGEFFFGIKKGKKPIIEMRKTSNCNLVSRVECSCQINEFDYFYVNKDGSYVIIDLFVENVGKKFGVWDTKTSKLLIFVDEDFHVCGTDFSPNGRYVGLLSHYRKEDNVYLRDYKVLDLEKQKIVKEYKNCLNEADTTFNNYHTLTKKVDENKCQILLLDLDKAKEVDGKFFYSPDGENNRDVVINKILKKFDKHKECDCCCQLEEDCDDCGDYIKILSDLKKIYNFDDQGSFGCDYINGNITIMTVDGKLIVLREKKNTMQYKDKINRVNFLVENYL